MDIDFPLVLTWAVLISGGIWLFDTLVLRPRRVRAAETLAAGGTSELDVQQTLKEPLPVEYARSFFPVLFLVLVLRSFLAEPYQIPSESMVPTLEVGDFILVNKYAYGIRLPVLGTKIMDVGAPQRGDVMVFVPPHDSRYFIKRVILVMNNLSRFKAGKKENKLGMRASETAEMIFDNCRVHKSQIVLGDLMALFGRLFKPIHSLT